MRAHYLQHVEFEGLGSIEHWLDTHGYDLTGTQFFRNRALPDPAKVDLLVVMGGPMSVNDEATLPWLVPEKAFVRVCIERGVPVLGVCLGAQLIASALGARVYRNPLKEIGWFPIEPASTSNATFQFPPNLDVFHWHGETFDLPAAAVHLARSEGCKHQAFQLGRRTIGLQFHLEMTPESVRTLVQQCGDEIVDAPYIQTAARMLEATPDTYETTQAWMNAVLSYLTAPRLTATL